ncbi:MAG: DNA polymerase III subunit delta, partial [Gammaproteobacteria bacterium]|nr:DNA polymerase III subunit delta [Gemmatimonadota bacterium]NIR40439.1 DNA polymerase III subunit delta [Actinomycetota bacterium]NIU78569.1 DNA polymerase III subunit delta [Gammaproteobacteria bacterium]NIW31909.1 DNA polymerase III subunit delta [Actinomycetota bacterium]
ARAIAEGRFPQSLLLYGPRGVGKQRLAIWAAAALDCRGAETPPCGACRSCRLAGRLEHPDIHWFFPLRRP